MEILALNTGAFKNLGLESVLIVLISLLCNGRRKRGKAACVQSVLGTSPGGAPPYIQAQDSGRPAAAGI